MGKKFIILYRNYADKCWQGNYQTNSFLLFTFRLNKLRKQYECIDITVRK